MLEKILADVLNAHLGMFIEDLDKDQLGASIFTGQLELKNMKLKKTMFTDSPLPFNLEYGQVGRIYLKIPFWDMFSSPLIIIVEDVFGLIKIKPTETWDEELQRKAYNDAVQAVLDQFELFVKQKEILEQAEQENQSSSTFGEKFIARIIDNIQISIKNIYFRFEDKMSVSNQNEKYAIGVKLKEFSVYTSDKHFRRLDQERAKAVEKEGKEHDGAADAADSLLTFKVATVKGFSIFCDWDHIDAAKNGGIDLESLENIKDKADKSNCFYKILKGEFSDNQADIVQTHKYLIDGFQVSLHLKLNKNIKFPSMPASLDHPQIWARIIIGDEDQAKEDARERPRGPTGQRHGNEKALLLSIYQPQILRILKTVEIIGFFNEFKDGALTKFKERKLTKEEKEDYLTEYVSWRCLEDSQKDTDIEKCKEHRENMKKHEALTNDAELIQLRNLGKKKFQTKQGQKKEREEIQKKIQDEISAKVGYGFFMSRESRLQIENDIKQKYDSQWEEVERKYKKQMMGNLMAENLKKLVIDLKRENSKSNMGPEKTEDEKTLEQMNYDMEYNKLPMDYVLYHIDIIIPGIDFTIDNEYNQKLLIFNLDQLALNFEQSKQTMTVDVRLEDFEIKDNWSQSKVHPCLIEAVEHENQTQLMMDRDIDIGLIQDDKRHQNAQALKINYVTDSTFKKCPFKIQVRVEKQLHIIVLIPLLNELQRTMGCAFSDQKLDFEYFQKYATGKVKELTDVAQTYADSIKKGDYEHTNVDINLKMYAPVVKIPENIFSEDSPYLELNTGIIRAKSDLLEFNNAVNYNEIVNDWELYDKYQINLENLSLNLIFPGAVGNKKEIKIINNFTFVITVENCLAPLHEMFPTLRLDIDFKEPIEFDFDFYCLKTIFRLKDLLLIQLDTSDVEMVETKIKKKQEIEKKREIIKNKRRSMTVAAPENPKSKWQILRQKSRLQQIQKQRAQKHVNFQIDDGDFDRNGEMAIHDQIIHETISDNSNSSSLANVGSKRKAQSIAVRTGQVQESGNSSNRGEAPSRQESHGDNKKDKFLREQKEKSLAKGADMEITFNLKKLLIILTADRFTKSSNLEKSAAENPSKQNMKAAAQKKYGSLQQQKSLSSPSEQAFSDPKKEDDDYVSYSVTFEMKGLMTKIKMENNQNDMTIDFSVDTFQIKDSEKNHSKMNKNISQHDQQKLHILNKIMSSPLDDYEIIALNHQDGDERCIDSESGESIHQEKEDKKRNDSSFGVKSQIKELQKSQRQYDTMGELQKSFYKDMEMKNSNDEKELYVQCIMKSNQYYDDDYEEVVENSTMEINCCINRSRLIVNIPTVSNFIKIYAQLMKFLEDGPKNYDQLVIENKKQMMKALSMQSYSHQSSDSKDAYPLILKIFQNLARQNGSNTANEIKNYLNMITDCLKETIEAKIWQSDIRKTDGKNINESTVINKSEMDKVDPNNSDADHEGERLSKLDGQDKIKSSRRGADGEPGNATGRKFADLMDYQPGPRQHTADPHNLAHSQEPMLKKRVQIVDDAQEDCKLEDVISQQIEQERRRKESQPEALQPPKYASDANTQKKLYFVKETYWRSVMNVKVKLKNMELWITDYNGEPEKKAQILQLKFMSDLFYDCDQFGKEIKCSQQPLKHNGKYSAINHQYWNHSVPNEKSLKLATEEDVDERNLDEIDKSGMLNEVLIEDTNETSNEDCHIIRKVLESKDHMQFNLSKLAIEQMIVQRWLDVSFIVWELFDAAHKGDNLIDKEEQNKNTTNYSSGSEDSAGTEGGIIKEESQEESSEDSENLSHSHSEVNFNIDDIQFAQCPILKPTGVSIMMQNQQQHRECRYSMINIELESLYLTADFKDIDLMYYLYKRYEECIYDDLQLLQPQAPPAEEQPTASQAQASNEQDAPRFEQPRKARDEATMMASSADDGYKDEALIEKGKRVKVEEEQSPLEDRAQLRDPMVMSANEMNQEELTEEQQQEEESEDDEPQVGDLINANVIETFKRDVSVMSVSISSIVVSLSDGELDNCMGSNTTMPTPMVELVINKLLFNRKSNIVQGSASKDLLAVPLDIYYSDTSKYVQPFDDMNVSCGLYATYYNQMSQAFEPFIEPWSLNVKILQQTEDDIQEIDIKSEQFLEINFTYGMALTIRDIKARIMEKTFQIHEDMNKEKERSQKKADQSASALSADQIQEKAQDHLKMEYSRTNTNSHALVNKTNLTQKSVQKMSLKNGYTFQNFFGTGIGFCVSDKELDANLNINGTPRPLKQPDFRRQSNLRHKQAQVPFDSYKVCLEGSRQNAKNDIDFTTKEQSFFDIQKQNIAKRRQNQVHDANSYFNDDIENEPLTIDLKIEGIEKFTGIPIEIVGVYSFSAKTEAQSKKEDEKPEVAVLPARRARSSDDAESARSHKIGQDQANHVKKSHTTKQIADLLEQNNEDVEQPHDVNIIVNINTEGKQRIINFESQLLFVNNMSYQITLVFVIRKMSRFASKLKKPLKKPAVADHKPALSNARSRTLRVAGRSPGKAVKFDERDQQCQSESDDDDGRQLKQQHPGSASRFTSFEPSKSNVVLHSRTQILEEQKFDTFSQKRQLDSRVHEDSISIDRSQNRISLQKGQEPLNHDDSVDLDEQDKADQSEEGEIIKLTLDPNDIYKIPLMWMMLDSAIDVGILHKKEGPAAEDDTEQDAEPIFEDIQKIFNKTAAEQSNPNFCEAVTSKIIELNEDFYVCVDIQGYQCVPKNSQNKNPLQYVVSLNPPLMLANYSMSPLELFEIDNPKAPNAAPVPKARIAPSMSAHIIELDLTENNKSHIKLTFTDTVSEKHFLLSTIIEKFNIPQSTTENMVEDKRQQSEQYLFRRYQRGQEFKDLKTEAGSEGETCQIQVDTIKKVYSDVKAYHENFNFRTKLIDISIAVKIMIYPKFMIVNKTCHDITIKRQVIKQKTNDFLFEVSDSQKSKFGVEGYHDSKAIDIETIGMSGEMTLDRKEDDKKKDSIDPKAERSGQSQPEVDNRPSQLQFGLNISQAQFPFNKTTIVTVVPRYLIVNKLDHPIQIRQACNSQMPTLDRKEANRNKNKKGKAEIQTWGKKYTIPNYEGEGDENQQYVTEEFHLMKSKSTSMNKKEHKIQFKALRPSSDAIGYETNDEAPFSESQIDSSTFMNGDPTWTKPFSVNDLEDFQTECEVEGRVGAQRGFEFWEQRQNNQGLQPEYKHGDSAHNGSKVEMATKFRIQRLERDQNYLPSVSGHDEFAEQQEERKEMRDLDESPVATSAQQSMLEWFQPQKYNNFKLFTRVIVTANPLDNDATILLIFGKPAIEEYVIKNRTDRLMCFTKWDHSSNKPLSEKIALEAGEKQAFTWDYRDIPMRQIQIRLAKHDVRGEFQGWSNNESVISMDKCSEFVKTRTGDQTNEIIQNILFRDGKHAFKSHVQFNSSGTTKIITITKELNRSNFGNMDIINRPIKLMKQLQQVGQQDHLLTEEDRDKNTKPHAQASEKQTQDAEEQVDLKKKVGMKVFVDLKGLGFTFIDNHPKELMFIQLCGVVVNYSSISQTQVLIDSENASGRKELRESTITNTKCKLTLGNFQIDNLVDEEMPVLLGSQNYYALNLIKSSHADIQSNLSKFYRIMPDDNFKQAKKAKKRENNNTTAREEQVPFIKFDLEMSQREHKGKIGTIVRYDKIHFGIQEFFLQIESAIVNENFKLVMDIINIFSEQGEEDMMTSEEEYLKSLNMFRRDQCNLVDATQGVVFDASRVKVDKITFGVIQIAAIRVSLTFKLKIQMLDFDIENPRALFGLMNIVYPFLSQLASITDARLAFNELIFVEGFYSQEQLTKNINRVYWNQGIRQVFKMLGSSDMMGNATGLIEKVGVAFIVLAREPIKGIQEGPEEFLNGLRTGFQGLVSGVVGGSFHSLSLVSGSMYGVVKQTTGNEDIRQENATNIANGVYYGIKGMGSEVYQGAKGVFVQPWEGYKQGGKRGLVKGIGRGVAGAATAPVTGVLRAGQSVSQGISGTANYIGDIGKTKLEKLDVKLYRTRPPRRIDLKGQIRVYNEDMAIINRVLTKIKLSKDVTFQNQLIRYYALLPTIDESGQTLQNRKSLLVITNEYLIYLRVYNFLDMQKTKYLQKCLLLSEKLSNIVNYQIKKRPSHIGKSPDQGGKQVYIKPQYFLTVVFKKPWVRQNLIQKTKIQRLNRQIIQQGESQSSQSAHSKVSVERMAPRPGVDLSIIQEEKEDGVPMPRADGPLINGTRQNYQSAFHDLRDGDQSFKYSQASGNNSVNISSGDSFVEGEDSKSKYRYVFYSPSLDIFNRVHQVFQTMPEIHQNLLDAEKEKLEKKRQKSLATKGQRSRSQKQNASESNKF